MFRFTTINVAATAVCAGLYFVVGYLTSFGFSVGGVAFWPAAFIPAIFAVLFGPWVGGVGAAIGIFLRDVLYHGDPMLSLTVGVSANFAAFFLMGYLSRSNLDRVKTLIALLIGSAVVIFGLLLPTFLLPNESTGFTSFSTSITILLFSITMGISIVLFLIITKTWPEFKTFGIAAIIGQGIGAAIVSIGVWGYSQLFFSPTGYFKSAVPTAFVPIIFVWTVVTEIPFVLLISPPIIKMCYKAFPFLNRYFENKEKAN